MSFFVDGAIKPNRERGEWKCYDCGAINGPDDASCDCDAVEGRLRDLQRRSIKSNSYISPAGKRRLLGGLA